MIFHIETIAKIVVMLKIVVFAIYCTIINANLEQLTAPRAVLTHGGAVRGTHLISVHGRIINAFLGIPYAEPPVERLRFALTAPRAVLTHGGAVRGTHLISVHGRIINAFLGIPYAEPPVERLRFALTAPRAVLTHGGAVRGTHLISVHGRIINAFLGIPYAEPPVERLRFARPVSNKWSGERNATSKSNPCLQFDFFQKSIVGNEDCLYLNVYVPHNPPPNLTLPVMVWIHGGAYHSESSDPLVYGPERLLDHDIVLVTFNYRLGALGFLSTGTLHLPGNFGLKDQNLALHWVRDNIRAFGGNPDKITIFGQSAGGASVSLHMISPASKGLFSGAIMQSGNYFDTWAMLDNETAVNRTKQIARRVDCPTHDFTKMVNCIRLIPPADIVSAQLSLFYWHYHPILILGPVIEPESPDAFLTNDPRDLGDYHGLEIPIIIGTNSDDGGSDSAFTYQFRSEFEQRFDELLPHLLFYEKKSNASVITKQIKNHYFDGRFNWSNENLRNLSLMFSDRFTFSGLDQYLRQRFNTSGNRTGDTYLYIFSHNGPISAASRFGGGPHYYGVTHYDELPFLFPFEQLNVTSKTRDRQMYSAMPKMWASFAKTGNPTPLTDVKNKWKKIIKYPQHFSKIGSEYFDSESFCTSGNSFEAIAKFDESKQSSRPCNRQSNGLYDEIVSNINGDFWNSTTRSLYS